MVQKTEEFYKKDRPRPTEVSLKLRKLSLKNRQGDEGEKFKAATQVVRGEQKSESHLFFVKDLSDPRFGFLEMKVEAQQEKWDRLRKLGLPVLSTFRINADKTKILMTDASEGGKKKLYDTNSIVSEKTSKKLKEKENIGEKVKELALKAFDNGNGVFLSVDAYTLIVDKEGNWEIKIIDLGIGSYVLTDGLVQITSSPTDTREITAEDCLRHAEMFMDDVVEGNQDLGGIFFGG